jgi:DNA-binding NarL/FixJ family response regulator
MSEQAIRLFLVDDHKIFVQGVVNILSGSPGIEVTGWGYSSAEALAFLEKNKVDIVVTDIEMPLMSGIDLAKQIKETYPETKVIGLSMFDKKEIIHELISAGAEGYLLKDIEKKELLTAITRVAAGDYYYSGSISEILMKSVSGKELLTRREREIIKLIALEKTNVQIAAELFISEHTVEAHRKNIFRKTKAKSIIGLIKYAYENKLA